MICAGNVLLVLDANVMLRIVRQASGDIAERISSWLVSAVAQAQCNIEGKTITIVVSRDILADYRIGFNRTGNSRLYLALDTLFEKGWSLRRLPSDRGTIRVMLFLTSGSGGFSPDRKMRKSARKIDKFDREYLFVTLASASMNRFSDRHILFASEDHTCLAVMQECLAHLRSKSSRHIDTSTWSEICGKLANHSD